MRGFTLVEILIATTIASLAGALLIGALVQNNGFFFSQTAQINQGLQLNDSLVVIKESIRSASSVAAQYPSGSPTYITEVETLVLTLPSIDASSNVITDTFDYIVITKEQKILKKYLFPDSASSRKAEDVVLSINVSNLQFIYFDQSNNIVSPTSAEQVKVIINSAESWGFNTKESSVSSQINLRNN